jgi:hypothetical protein
VPAIRLGRPAGPDNSIKFIMIKHIGRRTEQLYSETVPLPVQLPTRPLNNPPHIRRVGARG